VGAVGLYGRESTSLAGTVSAALATPLGTFPFARFDSINDSVTGFGDVLPIATFRWNSGVHNYMTYKVGLQQRRNPSLSPIQPPRPYDHSLAQAASIVRDRSDR
jgi:hypothetical protein